MNVSTSDLLNPWSKLNLTYAMLEVAVSLVTVIGNLFVLVAFKRERKLRRRTNYYIVSLATADLLVGLIGIPCAILASVGLPRQLHCCLFSVSLLIVLCTISIFSLVAVSLDRYWAILYPMSYSRHVNSKFALGVICLCWITGCLVGFLPLFGWHSGDSIDQECLFTRVMDYNYLVFLYFTTIVGPALLLAAFYSHIYNVILKQLRQMVSMIESGSVANGFTAVSTVRVLTEARRKEVKATQNLSIIVLFFILCWMPLYTINCIQAFYSNFVVSDLVMNSCIILSHLNSAGNPLLYAYHLSDFRNAFRTLLFASSSSSESVVIAGVGTNPHYDLVESAVPKKRPFISISFNPHKYRFKKDSRKLFKFEKDLSNMDLVEMEVNQMTSKHTSSVLTDNGSVTSGVHSTAKKNCYNVISSNDAENNYAYVNSICVVADTESKSSVGRRNRVQSVNDDVSPYMRIMSGNDDDMSQEKLIFNNLKADNFLKYEFPAGVDIKSSTKNNMLQRRHSTNV